MSRNDIRMSRNDINKAPPVDFWSLFTPRVEWRAFGVTHNSSQRCGRRNSRLRSKTGRFEASKTEKTPEKPILERPQF